MIHVAMKPEMKIKSIKATTVKAVSATRVGNWTLSQARMSSGPHKKENLPLF